MRPARVADRYEILDTLGSGGMAAVYLARDEQLDRLVAVKMLLVKDLSDGQAIRFQNEAKAIGRLKHSAIMTALDFGVTADNQPYLVLDYKEGTTLDTILERRGRLEITEALLIAARICEGLAYAHKSGVLHRDIKPSNIYLTEGDSIRDSVKILDFGIAKFQSTREANSADIAVSGDPQYLTHVGAVIGSPAYMSPEQSRAERVDELADIYSMGCVLFEMLTGKPPIIGSNAVETLARKSERAAPTLSSQLPDGGFSSALEAIVSKSLEIDRSKRFQKADEMLAALESQLSAALEQGGALVPSEAASSHSARSIARVTPLVAMILLVVLIGSTLAFFVFARPAANTTSTRAARNFERPLESLSSMFACGPKECEIRNTASDADFRLAAEQMKEWSTPVLNILSVKNLEAKNLRHFKDLEMHSMKLQNMDLSPGVISELNEFSKLTYLKLEDCKLESTILSHPEKLPRLTHLLLADLTLTEEDCNNILKFRSMETLNFINVRGCSVELVRELSKLQSLKNLLMEGKYWTAEHIKLLPQINVTSLDVTATTSVSTDLLIRCIAAMKRVRFLSLESLELKKGCLRYLEPATTIEFIKLCQIENFGKEEMVSLAKMKRLNNIELNSLHSVSDISPLLGSKSLRTLRLVRIPIADSTLQSFRQRDVNVKVEAGRMGLSADEVGEAVNFASTVHDETVGTHQRREVERKVAGTTGDGTRGSVFGLDAGPHAYFDNAGVCQLSGSFTEEDIKRLADDIKKSNRINVGISMTNVENFRGEWLEHLIPVKPVRFKASSIEFDDTTLRLIGQMTRLRHLSLDQNPFRPGSLHYLKNLQKIDHISMTGVNVNDADMETISGLKAVNRIEMKAAHGFSTKGLESLAKLPSLSNLEIGGPTLTLDQTRCLRNLKHVQKAELAGRLEGNAADFLKEMSRWPVVSRLTISSVDLGPDDLKVIAMFPHLKILKFYNLSIEDKDRALSLLVGLNSLESLELSSISGLTDEDVLRLRAMKNLKELILSNNDLVSKDTLSQLRKLMPGLARKD